MKINEVLVSEGIIRSALDEALMDFVPGTSGNKMRKASAEQQKRIAQVVKKTLEKWAVLSGTMKSSGQQPTQEQAVQWLTQFMGQRPSTNAPTTINNDTMKQWLTQEIASYISKKALPPVNNVKSPAQPSAVTPPAPQQATQQATPGQVGYTSPTTGISVKQNKDPWILTYKGKNFMLNDKGYWALDGKGTAGAQAAQAMQTEFDRVAGPGFDQTGTA